MKLCVLENIYADHSFDESLERLEKLGIEYVEIGAGGYPGKDHCDPEILLEDGKKYDEFINTLDRHHIKCAALACHGNPIHPDRKTAENFDRMFKNAILLAEKMGIDTIVGFSGCPGDCEESKYPNWVTCAWPGEYLEVLEWQWNEKLVPYWKDTARFAKEHHVTRIAFEMHPGFMVYNPEKLLKLREDVGDTIGANLDPSHLFWQGIDIPSAISALGDAIYHFHAKDTKINPLVSNVKGVLDTEHYTKEAKRSWIFRTVGYGHGEDEWKNIMSALRMAGYDRVISIEHEDSLMSRDEGLEKAVEFMKGVIINEPKPGSISWA